MPDGAGQGERPAQLGHFPGQRLARSHPSQDAFDIPELAQIHLRIGQNIRMFQEILDDVVAGFQLLEVQNRHGQGTAEHARAHRGRRPVQGLHQGDAPFPGSALEYLQVAEGELVHPHELGFVDTADGADVLESGVLGLFQIDQQGPGRANPQGMALDTESLQGIHPELPFQALHGGIVDEGPLVNGGDEVIAEALPETLFPTPLHHQFLGGERPQQRADIIQRPLGHLELPGGHVQEGRPAAVLLHHEPAEVVVLLGFQHVFSEGDARGDDFRDSALDQFLGEPGVFQLVANGHLEPRPH